MLTDDQRKERVKYIGASDAAAVLGMSRWSSPLQVWAEKTGAIVPEDISGKLPVRLGNMLEDAVATLFQEETGKKVHRVNETIYHPDHKFIGANLDRRVVGESAVLECKTASAWKQKEWEGDEFPQEYVIQVLHQMAVTGYDRGYLAVLIGNQDFKIKTIERDDKVIRDLVRREVDFWTKFVIPGVMPAVTSKDKDALEALFPTAVEGKEIDLDSRAEAIIEVLEGMNSDLASLTRQIEAQRNELKQMLGDAEVGHTGKHDVVWANVTAQRLDTDAFKKALPEIYQKYGKPTTTRRLLIKTSKQEKTNG